MCLVRQRSPAVSFEAITSLALNSFSIVNVLESDQTDFYLGVAATSLRLDDLDDPFGLDRDRDIFGWVNLVRSRALGRELEVLGSAVAYDAQGIVVGTNTAVVPETHFRTAGLVYRFGARLSPTTSSRLVSHCCQNAAISHALPQRHEELGHFAGSVSIALSVRLFDPGGKQLFRFVVSFQSSQLLSTHEERRHIRRVVLHQGFVQPRCCGRVPQLRPAPTPKRSAGTCRRAFRQAWIQVVRDVT